MTGAAAFGDTCDVAVIGAGPAGAAAALEAARRGVQVVLCLDDFAEAYEATLLAQHEAWRLLRG